MLLILFWIFPEDGIQVANIELNFITKEDFKKENIIKEVSAEKPPPIVINYDSINKVKKHIQDSLKNVLLIEEKLIKEALILSKKTYNILMVTLLF